MSPSRSMNPTASHPRGLLSMSLTFLLSFIILSTFTQIYPVHGAAAPRYAALDHTAILRQSDLLAPRWYAEGIPAVPVSPNPNYVFSRKRQDSGTGCAAGAHTCEELGLPSNGASLCCPNDRYCYLDSNWTAKCCSLGVKCPGSLCEPDQIFWNATFTTTSTETIATKGSTTTLLFGGATTSPGCRIRPCSEGSYQCQPTFGAQCCSNDYLCATSGSCIRTATPSTSVSTVVPEIPPGCTTSQITCAASDGGGCCNIGSVCVFSSIPHSTPTAVCSPNITALDGGAGYQNGLTSGARAGVGVGVAVAAALVIAAITWLCIRKRRGGKTNTNGSAVEMARNPTAVGGDSGTARGVGGGVMAAVLGRRNDSMRQGPLTPWTARSAFSDITSPTAASARPPLHDHGRAYDYFGPDAVDGPFTDRGEGHGPERNLSTSPALGSSPPISEGYSGVVPYNADYIRRPVELGGNETTAGEKEGGIETNVAPMLGQETEGQRQHEEGPVFELAGSPSPEYPLPDSKGGRRGGDADEKYDE